MALLSAQYSNLLLESRVRRVEACHKFAVAVPTEVGTAQAPTERSRHNVHEKLAVD